MIIFVWCVGAFMRIFNLLLFENVSDTPELGKYMCTYILDKMRGEELSVSLLLDPKCAKVCTEPEISQSQNLPTTARLIETIAAFKKGMELSPEQACMCSTRNTLCHRITDQSTNQSKSTGHAFICEVIHTKGVDIMCTGQYVVTERPGVAC